MNKAFTKESDGADEDDDDGAAALPPLPAGARNYITPAGYARLRSELMTLLDDERPKMVETVSWAAKNGDRSENGDYLYGKKRLREIDRRIRFLTKRLDIAEVADPSLHHGSDQVFFGATVTYADEAGVERTITIKGIDEADNLHGEVSWVAPIARALLKAREGDEVTLVTPKGPQRIEVLSTADRTFILSNTRARCTSTVRTLMPRASATRLLGRPSITSAITSRSRSVSSASACATLSPSRCASRWARLAARACSMRSTSALSENGFSTKSNAPRLTAATAVGTSPWPVRKMTGSAPSRCRSIRRSNSARPLMPGMRTSSSRHEGAVGQGGTLVSSIASKASALAKASESSRRERSSQAIASRNTASSSTR
jgi:transcription elongation factor GreB